MTEATPKPRPWFQLHLSTCVVMMVVAGALVFGNITTRGPFVIGQHAETVNLASVRGWPMAYQCVEVCVFLPEDGHWVYHWPSGAFNAPQDQLIDFRLPDSPKPLEFQGSVDETHINALLLNSLVAVGAIMLTAFVCEFLIRRRARSRQDPAP